MFAVGSPRAGARTLTRLAGLALAGLALTVVLLLAGSSPAQAKPAATALPMAVTLKSLATGYVLDSNEKGHVYGLAPNGASSQKWIPARSDNNTVTVTNRHSKRCLDSDVKGKVYTLPCKGGPFQKWFVQPANSNSVMLRNLATGRVLVGDAAKKISTLPKNGGPNQKWNPVAR
jgi:hypothetical protein